MKIEIRRNGAVIITIHTRPEKFDSDYDRSKFFRELHGWNQVVPGEDKKYQYRRPGLLDEVPHIKVADSVFIVAMKNMQRMMEFFDEWSDKVEYDMMQVILNREKMKRLMQERNINMDR
ncbi:MAG: hypothetical protein V1802_01565 [Candidatus Aenigmatarchaeota archaeon]